MEVRIIIAGGRYFNDYQLLKDSCNHILSEAINIGAEIIIVSGKAKGADSLGERYAKKNNFKVEEYPALWQDFSEPCSRRTRHDGSAYNALAGMKRNKEMAKVSDALIAFWDGKSTGTKNMIDLAKEFNLQSRVINY